MTRLTTFAAPPAGVRAGSGLALAAVLLVACSSPAATTPPPGQTTGPTPGATAPSATDEIVPTPPGQSDTAWGRIWNDIPDSFPEPIDAAVADPGQGPASGAWTVPVTAVSAPQLAGFYRDALDELGWTANIDGPLEDGSYTVASVFTGGCQTLTTILPRGDESLVTVLFGAACPFR